MAWRYFEQNIIRVTNERRPKKRIKEAFKETSASMFLDYLRPKLHQFIMHNSVARWQDNQCKLAMANLPSDALYHTLILLEIAHFKSRMRFSLFTSIHSKSIY